VSASIGEYALLSDCRTGALVSRHGSIDWFCPPRWDAPSVFGALLGTEEHGHWTLRPVDRAATVTRRYDGDTFVLVTRWETATGVAEVHEFMPVWPHRVDIVRRIVGLSGRVPFETALRLRFDYARAIPWVRQLDGAVPELHATAGPDRVTVRGIRLEARDHVHRGTVSIDAGGTHDLTLTWSHSFRDRPEPVDVDAALVATRTGWQDWADHIAHDGPYRAEVIRSLLVLRALSHADTGGIVAAATTSLPEQFGGARNWDYRYVWLRDASLTLQTLVAHGFVEAADHWRLWLLRAIAGDPAQMQIMYGIAGERDLAERELASLPGYKGAAPVRIGNGAVTQFQADVVGEVMVALQLAREAGLAETEYSWPLQLALVRRAEVSLDRPDNGIWEIRGEPRRFTHSRAMLWAAFDRAVTAAESTGLRGPVAHWRRLRDDLAAEIAAQGVASDGHFTQYYGTDEVDASLLILAQVGFCAYDDPRMVATVARIERDLMPDGFVRRYRTSSGVDGLAGAENPFLACSFWLVEQYAHTGRCADAERLMAAAAGAANDLGLLSEEYDPAHERQAGNTPQAFSHLALVRAADALAAAS